MQRTARPLAAPFGIERLGDRQRVGVDLEHMADGGPLPIKSLDAGEILSDERTRGVLTRLEAPLEVGQRGFLELECGDGWRPIRWGSLLPGRRRRPSTSGSG